MTQPHTPAPWRTEGKQDENGELFIRSENGVFICEIMGESFDEFAEEEREANAQLIAAAPDLLDALKDLVERERTDAAENGFTDDEMTWLEDARRALAKATGT